MGDSLRVSYQSEMNWDGNENENDDDRNRTWGIAHFFQPTHGRRETPFQHRIGTSELITAVRAKKAGITSTAQEKWVNCVPLAVRRRIRSLVHATKRNCNVSLGGD